MSLDTHTLQSSIDREVITPVFSEGEREGILAQVASVCENSEVENVAVALEEILMQVSKQKQEANKLVMVFERLMNGVAGIVFTEAEIQLSRGYFLSLALEDKEINLTEQLPGFLAVSRRLQADFERKVHHLSLNLEEQADFRKRFYASEATYADRQKADRELADYLDKKRQEEAVYPQQLERALESDFFSVAEKKVLEAKWQQTPVFERTGLMATIQEDLDGRVTLYTRGFIEVSAHRHSVNPFVVRHSLETIEQLLGIVFDKEKRQELAEIRDQLEGRQSTSVEIKSTVLDTDTTKDLAALRAKMVEKPLPLAA